MQKLSEIISKSVLNIYSGKIEGIICDAVFDKALKKITHLKVFDEQEEEYLLSTNKIYNIGENMCVIKNSEALDLITPNKTLKTNNPINKKVISTSGKEIGIITNIEIDDKFNITNFETISSNISPNTILNISENIIVNLENKKIKLNSLKPKIKKESTKDNVVSILPKIETTEHEQKESQKKEPFKINSSFMPTKLSSNVEFLIGRKVSKTIYGLNNEILIKKDNLITSKNLENAKKHSKIAELALFSKQKA